MSGFIMGPACARQIDEAKLKLSCCRLLTIARDPPIGFFPLEILMPKVISRDLRLGRWSRTGFGCHDDIASGDIEEKNGIVDADRKEDSGRILFFAQDIGVDQDQEYGDREEACDVTEHLSSPLPG
jgi:hypothetical protein